MTLYDAKEGRFISENYIVKWGKEGLAKDLDQLNNLRVLFIDLGSKDLCREKVYLVCQIIRIGISVLYLMGLLFLLFQIYQTVKSIMYWFYPDLKTFKIDNEKVDPVCHHEFVTWRQNPMLDKSHPFLDRIYKEDILPCLHFANEQLSEKVLKAIEDNLITVESVSCKSPFPKKCSLLDAPRLCKYRMKLGEDSEWHYISQLCRNRIAAVCDFFCYLRYIQQGLVKNGIHEVYWEIMRKRREMVLAKLGLAAP